MDELLNIEVQGSKNTDMEVDTLNPIAPTLKILKPSSTEKTLNSFLGSVDVMFASFDIYSNCHPVNNDLMKDIATYARKSLDISKLFLHGLSFSRVTQKTEWMNRTADTINLPIYLSSMEDLLNYSELSNLCFIQAVDIDAINSEPC